MNKKVYLIILDGYGFGEKNNKNALYLANTPYLNSLFKQNDTVKLITHGESVGLPKNQTGGSEVGHITIGSGRPVKHLLTKINDQIESGCFFKNKKLLSLIDKAKLKNILHIIGLISDGGIHSFYQHIYGLLDLAKKNNIESVYLHVITDGRDVGERTIINFLEEIENKNLCKIATIGGRFFAMDRDNNWDRTNNYFETITNKTSEKNINWKDYIKKFYNNSLESDYYINPVLLDKDAFIKETSFLVNINFRTDRMLQLSSKINNFFLNTENQYAVFGPYLENAIQPFNFNEGEIKNTLGEVIDINNLSQLRISETEKFNHVTFFFSGQKKEKYNLEKRILVDSPKCRTYADKPEMSAKEQTSALKKELLKNDYSLIVQNYANTDLVGHSGNITSAIKSAETIDSCLKEIIPFAKGKGYEVLITADHGNSDIMINDDNSINSSHTQNFVPFVWISNNSKKLYEEGTLQDIAPTILSILELGIPKEMSGNISFVNKK
jgi:2,3-bisphosphoglycerate-independent phosphoglycerate mutase